MDANRPDHYRRAGDTEPFVALAVRLMRDGHSVRLAARPDFAGLAAGYGVDFAPLGRPYQPFIAGAAEASALGSGHLLRQLRYGLKQRQYFSDRLSQDAWRAAQGAEAIIYKYSWITGYTIAEKLGVPCAAAMLFPLTPTSAFPTFLLGKGADRGPLVNRALWSVTGQVVWQLLRHEDTKLRRQLGLRPQPPRGPLARQEREAMPVYYAYSPAVLPRPADWPQRMHVTGYWFLDPPPRWQPPPGLARFLQDGPPPVDRVRQHGQPRPAGHAATSPAGTSTVRPARGAADRLGRDRHGPRPAPARLHGGQHPARLAVSADGRGGPPRRGGNHGRRAPQRSPGGHHPAGR
jgi:sterol 3beta-glucosyltransferase